MTTNIRKGFTLVELLIVVGILAVLGTVVVTVLNPIEISSQGRDGTRLSDINILNNSLYSFASDKAINGGSVSMGSANTVYISIPDTSSTCVNLSLPTLPAGWSYSCVTQANLKKIDGTGWLPVNFTLISRGSPLPTLPTDPTNSASSRTYYAYVTSSNQYEISALMESQKYAQQEATDGGIDFAMYETGSNPNLSPFTHGLMGYWNFDEGSGTAANDTSGYSNTGTLSGTTLPTWVAGQVGQALSFAGSNSAVNVGVVSPNTAATFSAWIYINGANPNYGVIFSNYGTGSSGLFIGTIAGASSSIDVWFNSSSRFHFNGLPLNQWVLMTITHTGSAVTGYINGSVTNGPITSTLGTATTGVTSIGYDTNRTNYPFNGKIDDARIYNRALSAAEVAAIYNATK